MIKCVYVAMKKNVVFDVSLIDYDPKAMNRKFLNILKKRDDKLDFTVEYFPVAGHKLTRNTFKRLLDFRNDNGSLEWLVREIEKEESAKYWDSQVV